MGQDLGTQEELAPAETGHICGDCGKAVTYGQEIWLIQIVQPQQRPEGLIFHQICDEEDAAHDFLFAPYFFCFSCWENLYEDFRKDIEDEPPVLDPWGSLECSCCGSGIREWEYSGTYTLGELHPSKRAPSGKRGPQFVTSNKPELVCLHCMATLNENKIEMWPWLSQEGECIDCLQVRCWRSPVACECSCHTEEEETEEEGEST